MTRAKIAKIPKYKRRRQRPLIGRVVGWIVKLILTFLIVSVLWVLAYRFVNPPITFTMMGDIAAGRGAARNWMPIGEIDSAMVRGSIAAEDGRFCSHNGLD